MRELKNIVVLVLMLTLCLARDAKMRELKRLVVLGTTGELEDSVTAESPATPASRLAVAPSPDSGPSQRLAGAPAPSRPALSPAPTPRLASAPSRPASAPSPALAPAPRLAPGPVPAPSPARCPDPVPAPTLVPAVDRIRQALMKTLTPVSAVGAAPTIGAGAANVLPPRTLQRCDSVLSGRSSANEGPPTLPPVKTPACLGHAAQLAAKMLANPVRVMQQITLRKKACADKSKKKTAKKGKCHEKGTKKGKKRMASSACASTTACSSMLRERPETVAPQKLGSDDPDHATCKKGKAVLTPEDTQTAGPTDLPDDSRDKHSDVVAGDDVARKLNLRALIMGLPEQARPHDVEQFLNKNTKSYVVRKDGCKSSIQVLLGSLLLALGSL